MRNTHEDHPMQNSSYRKRMPPLAIQIGAPFTPSDHAGFSAARKLVHEAKAQTQLAEFHKKVADGERTPHLRVKQFAKRDRAESRRAVQRLLAL